MANLHLGTPVIFFLFYAAFIWYLCFRFRRTLWAPVVLFSALLFIAMVGKVHHLLLHYFRDPIVIGRGYPNDGRLFDYLLIVEAVITCVVGIFLACLPRNIAHRPCRKCGYELAGLEHANPTCPECGLLFAYKHVDVEAPLIVSGTTSPHPAAVPKSEARG